MKNYSDGKLNTNDEGDVKMALYIEDGRVILNFGKDLSWIGFDKATLKSLISGLQEKYEQI